MWVGSSRRFVIKGAGIAAYGCDTQALLGHHIMLASAAAAYISSCFMDKKLLFLVISSLAISLAVMIHHQHPYFLRDSRINIGSGGRSLHPPSLVILSLLL